MLKFDELYESAGTLPEVPPLGPSFDVEEAAVPRSAKEISDRKLANARKKLGYHNAAPPVGFDNAAPPKKEKYAEMALLLRSTALPTKDEVLVKQNQKMMR